MGGGRGGEAQCRQTWVAGQRGAFLVGQTREREQALESGEGPEEGEQEEEEGGSPGPGAQAGKQLCLSEQDVLRKGGGGVIKSFLLPLCIG